MMTVDDAVGLTAGTRTANRTFFALWMPYLFQRVEGGGKKHTFLPLNRFYKPLGTRDYVEYPDVAATHGVFFARDPATFNGIWSRAEPESGRFWLYDDSAKSRLDYFERYQALILKCPGVFVQ
jgi:hypothetical protein